MFFQLRQQLLLSPPHILGQMVISMQMEIAILGIALVCIQITLKAPPSAQFVYGQLDLLVATMAGMECMILFHQDLPLVTAQPLLVID